MGQIAHLSNSFIIKKHFANAMIKFIRKKKLSPFQKLNGTYLKKLEFPSQS